jgi:hypothetical protein
MTATQRGKGSRGRFRRDGALDPRVRGDDGLEVAHALHDAAVAKAQLSRVSRAANWFGSDRFGSVLLGDLMLWQLGEVFAKQYASITHPD